MTCKCFKLTALTPDFILDSLGTSLRDKCRKIKRPLALTYPEPDSVRKENEFSLEA
jgi:hypothetical protein